MPAAFVQSKQNFNSGTTVSITFDSNVTAGNLIPVALYTDGDLTLDSVADNLGNTYTAVLTKVGGTSGAPFAWSLYAKNINGGACTITATFSGSGFHEIFAHEVSGADTSAPLDKSASNEQNSPGTGPNAVTSTAVTTTADGEYIFGFATGTQNNTVSTGTGFTGRLTAFATSCTEDKIQTSAGSIAATFTLGTDMPTISIIMTFKAAGGGGGGEQPFVKVEIRPAP